MTEVVGGHERKLYDERGVLLMSTADFADTLEPPRSADYVAEACRMGRVEPAPTKMPGGAFGRGEWLIARDARIVYMDPEEAKARRLSARREASRKRREARW